MTGDKFKKAEAALTRVHKLFVAGVKRGLGPKGTAKAACNFKIKKKNSRAY